MDKDPGLCETVINTKNALPELVLDIKRWITVEIDCNLFHELVDVRFFEFEVKTSNPFCS